MRKILGIACCVLGLGAAGCQQPVRTDTTGAQSSAARSADLAAVKECPALPEIRADYVGPYQGVENVISPTGLMRDVYCAEAFKAARFPQGFVTVFGSSRIRESNLACDAAGANCDEKLKARHDALYASVRRFTSSWTTRYGKNFPILSGAGPGLMEAANRGASEAQGTSVGYTTYYDRIADATPEHPYGGDPRKALNPYVTNGLIFTSVAAREAAMIRHSAAIVIAEGGTGTEWEIYQIVEMVKSSQLRSSVPVYLFGERSSWRSLENRLDDLVARKVVARDELKFIRYASNPEELVSSLAADLRLR